MATRYGSLAVPVGSSGSFSLVASTTPGAHLRCPLMRHTTWSSRLKRVCGGPWAASSSRASLTIAPTRCAMKTRSSSSTSARCSSSMQRTTFSITSVSTWWKSPPRSFISESFAWICADTASSTASRDWRESARRLRRMTLSQSAGAKMRQPSSSSSTWHRLVVVEQRDDLALLPAVHHALDLVAHTKAQRVGLGAHVLRRREARVERFRQGRLVQVLPNEYQLALARLARGPRLVKRAAEQHVHAVEHKAARRVRHRQHALHAEDVVALHLKQPTDPHLHQAEVELALLHLAQVARRTLVEAHAADAAVVLCPRSLRVEEICRKQPTRTHSSRARARDGRSGTDAHARVSIAHCDSSGAAR
eukprot:4305739-Prymnesium_polylepis.1